MKKIALISAKLDKQNISAHLSTLLSESKACAVAFDFDQMFNPEDFDALVIQGDLDQLKKMTSYDADGIFFEVQEPLKTLILKFYQQSKPIGAIGLASLIVAQALKKSKPLITLGETSDLIPQLSKLNIQHEACPSNDYITDRDCKLLSTPHAVSTGVQLMIKELVEMA